MWGFERWWLRTLRYLGGLLLNLAGPAQPSPNHAPSPSSDSQAPLFWRPPHKPTWWNPGSSSITQAPQRLIPWPLLSGRQSQLRSQDCLCRGFWSQGTQTGLRVCGLLWGNGWGCREVSRQDPFAQFRTHHRQWPLPSSYSLPSLCSWRS